MLHWVRGTTVGNVHYLNAKYLRTMCRKQYHAPFVGDMCTTAILIIVEGHETAFNGFQYQFTTGKPLKSLKKTLNYTENGSMRACVRQVMYARETSDTGLCVCVCVWHVHYVCMHHEYHA
jgi:hypothetical protein